MKVNKKDSLTNLILTILEKTADGYLRLEDFLYNPASYAYGSGWDRPLKKSELSQAIKRLKDNDLIELKVNTEEIILKLTDLGRDVIRPNYFDESKWDRKWRIVIFDIPEQKRIVRNLFRRNLKKWGFKQLQKSVWISRMDVYQKLVDYVQDLKIESWVTIFESDKISNNII